MGLQPHEFTGGYEHCVLCQGNKRPWGFFTLALHDQLDSGFDITSSTKGLHASLASKLQTMVDCLHWLLRHDSALYGCIMLRSILLA